MLQALVVLCGRQTNASFLKGKTEIDPISIFRDSHSTTHTQPLTGKQDFTFTIVVIIHFICTAVFSDACTSVAHLWRGTGLSRFLPSITDADDRWRAQSIN